MTTPKGRDTRDRIVRAAAALMYERGVARTSTEDVCTAAGVSSSQLYHYFADKRALTHAVIEHQTAVVLGMQEPMLARLDSLDAVRAWADTIVAAQRAQHYRGCPLGSLAGELADHDKDARSELARSYQRWQRAIRDGLATMVQNGELRGDVDVEAARLERIVVRLDDVELEVLAAALRRELRRLGLQALDLGGLHLHDLEDQLILGQLAGGYLLLAEDIAAVLADAELDAVGVGSVHQGGECDCLPARRSPSGPDRRRSSSDGRRRSGCRPGGRQFG